MDRIISNAESNSAVTPFEFDNSFPDFEDGTKGDNTAIQDVTLAATFHHLMNEKKILKISRENGPVHLAKAKRALYVDAYSKLMGGNFSSMRWKDRPTIGVDRASKL